MNGGNGVVRVHFLNVGHGDCTLIKHASGRLTMIDINNGDDLDPDSATELSKALRADPAQVESAARSRGLSVRAVLGQKGYGVALTNPVAYLKVHYPGRPVFRYIQSHPHLDHMRGLAALRGAGIDIVNVWDTVDIPAPAMRSQADQADWDAYQALRKSTVYPTMLHPQRGQHGPYFNEDPAGVFGGDGLTILAPTPELTRDALAANNLNNMGYVIRFEHEGYSFILAGDAEAAVWESIVGHYGARALSCTVLKASHHGRDSGYYQPALALMRPGYTIVSVGKKPEQDASNKYRHYSENVWSTRWRGNITVTITGRAQARIDSQYRT